jgi:type IV pilus assembly protein PilB
MAEVDYKDPLLQQLFEDGLISTAQAEEILDEHERMGKPVRELLIDMDVLSEDALMEVLASHLGARVIDLSNQEIPTETLRSIPASVARMYNVIPVYVDSQAVEFATFDLLSPEVIDELNFVLTRDVSFVVAREAPVIRRFP